jgi:hypothetical protein
MENNSGKDELKRSAAPSGKEKLKLATAGDLEVRELRPLFNNVGRTQIEGTVTFNDADSFTVVYPNPTAVIPGQIIGAYDDGNFTKFHTAQANGGSSTVYLYYIDSDEGRQYYESPSGSGLPRTAINTQIINDDFLAMELKLVTISDQPTIVIGTIIIEIEEEEA